MSKLTPEAIADAIYEFELRLDPDLDTAHERSMVTAIAALEAVKRVRELHWMVSERNIVDFRLYDRCFRCGCAWPCSTIRALEGESEGK